MFKGKQKVFTSDLYDYGAINTEDESDYPSHIRERGDRGPPPVTQPPIGARAVAPSMDDFGDVHNAGNLYKALRSGRQRKKTAARSKGGDFQTQRKKRRIYFCCISSEIDVEKLADRFASPHMGMMGKLYDEVLHLYMEKISELPLPKAPDMYRQSSTDSMVERYDENGEYYQLVEPEVKPLSTIVDATDDEGNSSSNTHKERRPSEYLSRQFRLNSFDATNIAYTQLFLNAEANNNSFEEDHGKKSSEGDAKSAEPMSPVIDIRSTAVFWNHGGKEVFVFDFGAIVFWGYSREEVKSSGLIELLKGGYIDADGELSMDEFAAGEDDMAFVTSSEVSTISIANDVVTLPDMASVKSRLAVSFAIAQSSVLSIFEARVEGKVEAYKYIPEELSARGKVRLPTEKLANMIGEVFVIRHDVNLHSEILNIPDYFWKENAVEPLYRMAMNYLEMEPRTEVLNKRLDLLRELLSVLQQQHENAHAVKLEWTVIWLIVTSVILEVWQIVVEVIKLVYHKHL